MAEIREDDLEQVTGGLRGGGYSISHTKQYCPYCRNEHDVTSSRGSKPASLASNNVTGYYCESAGRNFYYEPLPQFGTMKNIYDESGNLIGTSFV